MLKRHHWPGHVQELENCLRRAAALYRQNSLDIADISFISVDASNRYLRDFISDRQTKLSSLAESQRHLIAEALDTNDWNFIRTARQLGIGRTTLWRKIRKYNLTKDSADRLHKSGVSTDD
jgi:two-component system response regulator HydG